MRSREALEEDDVQHAAPDASATGAMQAIEFEIGEYERRLAKAQRLMAERRIDALLCTTYANFRYFTGYTTHRWMQTTAPNLVIVPREGRPLGLLMAIETARAATNPWLGDVRPIRGYVEVGVKELVQAFSDLKLDGARIGSEFGSLFRYGMPSGDVEALRRALPHAEFVDASELFWALRIPKTAVEIASLREAVRIADKALATLRARVKPGMTEKDVFGLVVATMMQEGAEWHGAVPVASRSWGGTSPWDSHLRLATDRVIREGDMLWLDAACTVNGYWSDVTRMMCVGKARREWKDAYRFVHEAMHACIAEAKPGAPVSNAIRAYARKLEGTPHTEALERLKTARVAHGFGLDLIEPPSMSYADPTILAPGTVLTIEPTLSVPGAGFFILEEDVLVTETGYELMTEPAPPELPELG